MSITSSIKSVWVLIYTIKWISTSDKTIQLGKDSFFESGIRKTGYLHAKKNETGPTPHSTEKLTQTGLKIQIKELKL